MKKTRSYVFVLMAMVLGLATGFVKETYSLQAAEAVSTLFINFLKLIATPIVFLSIFSTLLGMRGFDEMKQLGKKVLYYTILTTIVAAFVALVLFLVMDPVKASIGATSELQAPLIEGSYLSFFLNIVPSNLVQAFLDNNVISIAFVAFFLGISALKLKEEDRLPLASFFSALFKLILKLTEILVAFLPIGIWAFTALLVQEMQANASQFKGIIVYLGVVLGANLIQGVIVIPLLLKIKGVSPIKTARGGVKALLLAFFSKSSNATLPVTLECAEKQLKIAPRVAQFSLPLCTVINMNGCAAFILTTVLFIAGLHGHIFSAVDLGLWVVLATLAAIGNAGVPMGCFFLSGTFLISMHVPVTMLGLILPFYTFLDMVETALNVWSDISVTAIVDKEVKEEAVVPV